MRDAPWLSHIYEGLPMEPPTRIADGWGDELVAEPERIKEHLRLSLAELFQESQLLGHAFIFCTRDPQTGNHGRCIYRIRIKPHDVEAPENSFVSQVFGVTTRVIAHYGEARAVAFISAAILSSPTEMDRAAAACWIITAMTKGSERRVWMSRPRRGPMAFDRDAPEFREVPLARMFDGYNSEHALSPLPPNHHLRAALESTRLALWDVLMLVDHRGKLGAYVLLERQSIVHLPDVKPRHRASVVVVNLESQRSILTEAGRWRGDRERAQADATRAADALHALGALQLRSDGMLGLDD